MSNASQREESRLPYVMRHFDGAFVGIASLHVWIYCLAHRFDGSAESVWVNVVLYVALSAAMLLVVAFFRKGRLEGALDVLDVPVAAAQSAATVLVLIPLDLPGELRVFAVCVAGICAAWMYLRWARFYAALDVEDAIASVFGAMIVGSVAKILIDLVFLPVAIALLACAPVISAVLARRARRIAPPQSRVPQKFSSEGALPVPGRIMLGVAAYSFIIGVMRALPAADVPGAAFVVVLHGSEVAVAAFVLLWVFARGGLLHFSSLWKAILMFTATAVLLIPMVDVRFQSWIMVLVSVAQTLVVMLLWTMLADVAHHAEAPAHVVFGLGWVSYSLPFACGMALGAQMQTMGWATGVVGVLAYLLTVAAVFALNEGVFSQRRIFADLDAAPVEQELYEGIDRKCAEAGEAFGLTAREQEVLQLICKGRSKSYIAETLFISENTVRSHAKHIYVKLGVHSKQEAIDLVTGGEKRLGA